MKARLLSILPVLVLAGCMATPPEAPSPLRTAPGDLPLDHSYAASSWQDRWIRVEFTCTCAWNFSAQPLMTGSFKKDDAPIYHHLDWLRNMTLGLAHGADHLEPVDFFHHNPMARVVAENHTHITAEIRDVVQDGRAHPFVRQSIVAALPQAVGHASLIVNAGISRGDVQAKVSSGPDLVWRTPSDFGTAPTENNTTVLVVETPTPIWVQLVPSFFAQWGPDAYGHPAYNGTRREPRYEIHGPARDWTFVRTSHVYATDSGAAALAPYFYGPPGRYEIRLAFPPDLAPADRILPYWIGLPFAS